MGRDDPLDANDGEELEAEIMPADHAFGVDLHGTTEGEAIAGPGLDRELAQERPVGRTVDRVFELADDGVPELEGELVGQGFLVPDDFVSPEESALSIWAQAPGATEHTDPHPVDEAEGSSEGQSL